MIWSGKVTSQLGLTPAIDCSITQGSVGSGCNGTYPSGTQVILTALPDTGSTFNGWSGAGCSGTGSCIILMDQVQQVTAAFSVQLFTLSVTPHANSNGNGTVTSSVGAINCVFTGQTTAGMCSDTYGFNATVTLTAAQGSASLFDGWGGACSGKGTCTVSMSSNQDVTARFLALIP